MYLRDPATRSLYFSTSKPRVILSTLQILTKDSVTVFVNAIMYYRVANPIHAVANVDDYSGSARLLAATTLRNVLGTMNLGDILSQRESIAKEMQVKSNIYCLNAIVKCFFSPALLFCIHETFFAGNPRCRH